MTSKKKTIKEIFWVVLSNVTTLVSSVFITAIVPKYLGVKEFSYWQLYVFYSTYAIYFQFGWLEGIYLKEGGNEFSNLNLRRYHFQLKMIMVYAVIVSTVLLIVNNTVTHDAGKRKVIAFVCVYFVIILIRTFYSYLFQATGKIKVYVLMNIVERLIFFTGCVSLLLFGCRQYETIILLDLGSRVVAVVIAALYGVDIICSQGKILYKEECIEILDDIRVGVKLMLAAASGLLINGVVRFFVDLHWDVETFGRISFSISLANFVIAFIGAVSVVFFPILKRIGDESKHQNIYNYLSTTIQVVTFAALCLFYPIKLLLTVWLPQYLTSIEFLAILFPLCYFESKCSVVNVTYLKAYREERSILLVNTVTLLCSTILTIISIMILDSMILGIFVVLICSMLKCFMSSFILYSRYNLGSLFEELAPMLVCVGFVVFNYFIGGELGCVLFVLVFLAFCLMKRNYIKQCTRFLMSN